MLFACYLGQPDGLRAWQEAGRAHACWLGLVLTVLEQSLPTGDTLSVAWLAANSASSPELRAEGAILWLLSGDGPAFGASLDETKRRWVRSRYAWLTRMRDLAERGYRLEQTVRGRLGRWRRSLGAAAADGAEGDG